MKKEIIYFLVYLKQFFPLFFKKKESIKPKRIIQFSFSIVPGKHLLFLKESKTTENLLIGKKYSIHFIEDEESEDEKPNDREGRPESLFTGIIIDISFDKILNQTTVYVKRHSVLNVNTNKEDIKEIKKKLNKFGWTLVDKPIKKNYSEHFRKIRDELDK
jgi:hypothetical protein